MKTFKNRYRELRRKNDSILVVGLDTDVERLPSGYSKDARGVLEYNKHIVDVTMDLVCGYKINVAFYERLGYLGWQCLEDTVSYIGNDIPIILDVKRGDISNTTRSYAKAYFETIGAGAVTVNPYMGIDAIRPFLEYKDRYTFVLCLTSNPSSNDLQRHGRPPLFEVVARKVKEWNEEFGNCGLVVGATNVEDMEKLRKIGGDDILYLIPGVGAQRGDVKKVLMIMGDVEILINVSRSIIFSDDIRRAALEYRRILRISGY